MKENKKIEKNKTYTYEELKRLYKNAMMKTLDNPTGKCDTKEIEQDADKRAKISFSLMLSGVLILAEMEKNLFENEDKHQG